MKHLRKKRTRTHVLEDLSVNHVEYRFLRQGWTIQRLINDYGIDLQVNLFNAEGYVEPYFFSVQLKATDAIPLDGGGENTFININIRDITFWSTLLQPLLLIVYDAKQECAYWLYFQKYFNQHLRDRMETTQLYHRIPVPLHQPLDISNCEVIQNLVRERFVNFTE